MKETRAAGNVQPRTGPTEWPHALEQFEGMVVLERLANRYCASVANAAVVVEAVPVCERPKGQRVCEGVVGERP